MNPMIEQLEPRELLSAYVWISADRAPAVEGGHTAFVVHRAGRSDFYPESSSATLTILDNDLPTVTIKRSIASIIESGRAYITISRSGPTIDALAISLAVGGEALMDADYTMSLLPIIPAGKASIRVPIIGIDDDVTAGSRELLVSAGPGAYVSASEPLSLTIKDNDFAPDDLYDFSYIRANISYGSGRLAGSGSYRVDLLYDSWSGDSYEISRISGNVAYSSGDYEYARTSTTTATVELWDDSLGLIDCYLTFSSATTARFGLVAEGHGRQTGTMLFVSDW